MKKRLPRKRQPQLYMWEFVRSGARLRRALKPWAMAREASHMRSPGLLRSPGESARRWAPR